MAAFNANSFAYTSYATARPDYPPSLYELILAYHKGGRDAVLDLGCGHGTVTRAIAPHFNSATGTDPSEGMLNEARHPNTSSGPAAHVKFVQGNAESLPSIKDNSVDLVVSGQAAHWFSYPPAEPNAWEEMRRIVKTNGTVAFWGYADPVFVGNDLASSVLHKWAYGKDVQPGREGMGKYWSFPGRARVEAVYGNIALPTEDQGWTSLRWVRNDSRSLHPWFSDVQSVTGQLFNTAIEHKSTDKERGALNMTKGMSIAQVKQFVRSWSGYHNWSEAHPDLKAREHDGTGDIVDWMCDDIAEQDPAWADEGHQVDVQWPVGMLLLRRGES